MGASRREFIQAMGGLAATGIGLAYWSEFAGASVSSGKTIPLIHCTDLFHPPNDPDDHVDLATVFALPQLDIRAVILDQGQLQAVTPGKIPLQQMEALTGRKVPWATGLGTPLRYPEDKGLNQFSQYQAGVELILQALRESEQKVFFLILGSARDVVAAYNREPDLFHKKTARLYFDDGNSGGGDFQWNPLLDPQAYIRLMTSELPVYWCPAFGGQDTLQDLAAGNLRPDEHRAYWKFRQSDVFADLPAPLQNYFLYALDRKDAALVNPMAYLHQPVEENLRDREWKQTRHMWSTASIYDCAGCALYRKGDSWVASPDAVAEFHKFPVYEFLPAGVSIDRNLKTTLDLNENSRGFKVFHILDPANYAAAMTSSLRRLLSQMPLVQQFKSAQKLAG